MNILVIDDGACHGAILTATLDDLAPGCVERTHPRFALQRAGDRDFSAAFVHQGMWEMDAAAMARCLRAVTGDLPIAFVGRPLPDQHPANLAFPAPMLDRPWDLREIREVLQRLLNRDSQQPRRRIARGTPPPAAPREQITVRCRDRSQLLSLCEPTLRGEPARLAITSEHPWRPGCELRVVLSLPGGVAPMFVGVIDSCDAQPGRGSRCVVRLLDLDAAHARRLMQGF